MLIKCEPPSNDLHKQKKILQTESKQLSKSVKHKCNNINETSQGYIKLKWKDLTQIFVQNKK